MGTMLSCLISGAILSNMVESWYEKRVTLNPLKVDEYGVPEPVALFSFSDTDLEVIRQMEQGMKQAAEAMKVTVEPICALPLGLVIHDMGTCRIGTIPPLRQPIRMGKFMEFPASMSPAAA